MARAIHTETTIDAPPATVWEVLADTGAYDGWNPFIRRLRGELRAGARLRVRLEPPGGRAMTFRPRVLRAEPGRELRWRGRLLVPGLVDGEHHILLQPLPGGRTRVVHDEHFRGLLVPAMGGAGARAAAGFRAMNDALRREAESRVRRERAAPAPPGEGRVAARSRPAAG